MKPFDLEAAKRGEPIVTREGYKVEFIAHVPNARSSNQVVCLHGVQVLTHDESGKCGSYNGESSLDIFMAPKKRTVWVNLYSDGEAFYHHTKEEANDLDTGAIADRIGGKAYPVEIEE